MASLAPLAGLTGLRFLSASRNRIALLSPLAGLTNLTHLDLDHNNDIKDVTPLAGHFKLAELDLADNEVFDVTPLSGLFSLTKLDLDENRIVNLSPLAGLTNLIELDLHSNRIINPTALHSMRRLTLLRVDSNFIDLSPGSDARILLDGLRARARSVIDHPQREVELSISRMPGGIRLSWPAVRGLRYELQSGSSVAGWRDELHQTFSGANGVFVFDLPAGGNSAFFRLMLSEEP